MSILDLFGGIVSDTGDQLEQLSADLDAANFNKNNAPSAIDNRSDNKGPEPEGLDVGRFVDAKDSPTGSPLVVVTNEISGTVSLLEVRPG